MNWTVEFAPGIWTDALVIWATSPDPAAARAAIEEVRDRLAADPHTGRHLSEGLWTIAVPPLAAFYTIDTARRYVEITAVAATA